MMTMTAKQSVLDALVADGPAAAEAERMTLYEPLIGSWEMKVTDYDAAGSRRTGDGEWHFAWALEGRAIQDVFIVPARADRRPGQGTQGNRYGTTVRVYDPAADAWHITWINPVRGAFNRLVGRRVGDEIVHEGNEPDGKVIRWIFSDITPESFRWRGEESVDEGKTWRLVAEFVGRRMTSPGRHDDHHLSR